MKKIIFLALVLIAPIDLAAYENTCGSQCKENFGFGENNDNWSVCEILGYSNTENCPEGYIVCPFDSNYIWCKSYDCSMGGLFDPEQSEEQVKAGYVCSQIEFHGLACYSCVEGRELCQYTEANKGEGYIDKSEENQCSDGTYKECMSLCKKTVGGPDYYETPEGEKLYFKDKEAVIRQITGAEPVWEVCRGCMAEEVIATNLRCKEGYTRHECEGNCPTQNYLTLSDGRKITCVPTPCPTPTALPQYPYEASARKDCAHETGNNTKQHPEGWLFEANGLSGTLACSRCIPKDCPVDTEKGLSACSKGYLYTQRGYAGDDPCGYCDSLVCPAPYNEVIQTIDDCPTMTIDNGEEGNIWSANKAWELQTLKTLDDEGNEIDFQSEGKNCNLCVPKACNTEEGFSEKIQSVNDCDNNQGYTFVYDQTSFYGARYCGKCVIEECKDSGDSNLTEQKCADQMHGSTIGVSMTTVGYSGTKECKKCECNAPIECKYSDVDQGSGGELSVVCCDGKYQKCENKTCEGEIDITPESINKNATKTEECTACGKTYTRVTECKDGYEVTGYNTCDQKSCSVLGAELGLMLVGQTEKCGDGYTGKTFNTYDWCQICEIKTCSDWGKESKIKIEDDANTTAVWYDAAETPVACDEGYVPTLHQEPVGNAMRDCFECSKKNSKEGYIEVATQNEIPSYVVSPDIIKSGKGYAYCAGSCADNSGYVQGEGVEKCQCVAAQCDDNFQVIDKLTRTATGFYTDSSGAFKYESCISKGVTKFKYIGCMDGYTSYEDESNRPQCQSQEGELLIGREADGHKCGKCLCNMSTVTCNWTATNAGTGTLYNKCCDGISYKNCSKNEQACPYTLYASDVTNASETESCEACGVTYYKIKKCREGYTGTKCENCDTENGYAATPCGGICQKAINCGSGTMECSADGHFVCKCATGWTGKFCNSCNQNNGYYSCGGNCLTKPICVHGTPTCDTSGEESAWVCSCEEGYAGKTCNTCDEGYMQFGEVCVERKTCHNHGTFNGLSCVCDRCFGGNECDTPDPLCYKDTDEIYKPKQCEQFGYSKTCKGYQNCVVKTPETYGGEVLNCFDIADKTCGDFCGKYTVSSDGNEASFGVSDSVYCKSIKSNEYLYDINSSIYAWLLELETDGIEGTEKNGVLVDTDNVMTIGRVVDGQAVNNRGQVIGTIKEDNTVVRTEGTDEIEVGKVQDGLVVAPKVIGLVVRQNCEGSACEFVQNCYFDDEHCSKGQKDISEFNQEDFLCSVVGYTPAGSECYGCKSKLCDNEDYVPSRNVEAKIAAGFRCTAISGAKTETGEQCYECLNDVCDEGYLWSKVQIPTGYRYKDDLVAWDAEETEEEPIEIETPAGHYCYKKSESINLRYCNTKANEQFDSARACETFISNVKNVTGQKIAECHQCLGDDDATLYWYPECKTVGNHNYAEIPTSNNMTYQYGYNCCASASGGYVPIVVYISEYKLGSSTDAQTCYALSQTCDGGLADDEYCAGTKCDEVKCNQEGDIKQYPYYFDGETRTIPAHAVASGETCIPTTTSCQVNMVYYDNFECKEQKTMYWKGELKTFNTHEKGELIINGENVPGCVCSTKNHFYATDDDCRKADENLEHNCQKDDDSECYIRGACDPKDGYDDEDACRQANPDYACSYNNFTECWKKGACDIEQGKYSDESTCKAKYTGHKCVQPEGKECFVKGDCDDTQGYYKTHPACMEAQESVSGSVVSDGADGKVVKDSKDAILGTVQEDLNVVDAAGHVIGTLSSANATTVTVKRWVHLGMTCDWDSSTECYVPNDCDESQNYYESIARCEQVNKDFKCKTLSGTLCAVVDTCNTELNLWTSEGLCLEKNIGKVCTQHASGCWTAGACDTAHNYWETEDACEAANPTYECEMGDKTDEDSENTCWTVTSTCNNANGYFGLNDADKPNMYTYSAKDGVCDVVSGCNNSAGYYDTPEECKSTNYKCDTGTTSQKYNKKTCYKRSDNCFTGFTKENGVCYCPTGRKLDGEECKNECVKGYWRNNNNECIENTCEMYKNTNGSLKDKRNAGVLEGACSTVDTYCNHCSDYSVDLPDTKDDEGVIQEHTKYCHIESEKGCADMPCVIGKSGDTDVCEVQLDNTSSEGVTTLGEVSEPGEYQLVTRYLVGHTNSSNEYVTCRTCQKLTDITCSRTKDCSDYPYRSDYETFDHAYVADKTSESCTKYMANSGSCQTFYKKRKCKAGAHWTGTECVVCDSFVLRWSEEAKKCVSVYCEDASVKYAEFGVFMHLGEDCGWSEYWNDSAKKKVRDASQGCNDGRLYWTSKTVTLGYDCYGHCECPK